MKTRQQLDHDEDRHSMECLAVTLFYGIALAVIGGHLLLMALPS